MIKKILLASMFLALAPTFCLAVSGNNTSNVAVKIYFKRSPEWKKYVKALEKSTDSDGVLEAKNLVEGWYKPVIKDSDVEAGQTLAVKLRMLNEDGKYIKNAPVDMYIKMGGNKVFIGTVESDENGWIESEGLVSGSEYYLEPKPDKNEIAKFSKKSNRPRIKVSAKKIGEDKGGDNWLQGLYTRVSENQILKTGDILEGYYKFSLKNGDKLPLGYFHVQATLRQPDGKKISKPTTLQLYAYPGGKETFLGEIKTSQHGEVLLPKLVPDLKFRVKIKD